MTSYQHDITDPEEIVGGGAERGADGRSGRLATGRRRSQASCLVYIHLGTGLDPHSFWGVFVGNKNFFLTFKSLIRIRIHIRSMRIHITVFFERKNYQVLIPFFYIFYAITLKIAYTVYFTREKKQVTQILIKVKIIKIKNHNS